MRLKWQTLFLAALVMAGCVVSSPMPIATAPPVPTATPTVAAPPTVMPTPIFSIQKEANASLRVNILSHLPSSGEGEGFEVSYLGMDLLPYEWTAKIVKVGEDTETASLMFKNAGARLTFVMLCEKAQKTCELRTPRGTLRGSSNIFDIQFQVEGVNYHVIWWYLGSKIHNKWVALISPQ